MDNTTAKERFERFILGMDYESTSIINDYIKYKTQKVADRERRFGRQFFIEGMLDAEVADETIISLLVKYYKENAESAAGLLEYYKTVIHPINKVCLYLDSIGFEGDDIPKWIEDCRVFEILGMDKDLWRLSPKDLYETLNARDE